MKNAVIIGAGQTGRGFIAPILQDDEYTITFIDKDEELIKSLNQKKEYSIHYFGNTAPTRKIDEFKAFVSTSEEAAEAGTDLEAADNTASMTAAPAFDRR